MAFQNVIFPELRLKHGVAKEILAPVVVTGNGNRELRRRQSRYERYSWTIPSRDLLDTDKVAIHKFLQQINFGLSSFLYQDPTNPELNNAKLSYRSGTTWFLNIPYDSTTPGTHPIFNPQMGSLAFKKNGSSTSATFTIDSTTGLPYITITGSISTDMITVSGPLYMTTRIDSNLNWSITGMAQSSLALSNCDVVPYVVTLGDIKLVEVFES